jgi:hypothetical protein
VELRHREGGGIDAAIRFRQPPPPGRDLAGASEGP